MLMRRGMRSADAGLVGIIYGPYLMVEFIFHSVLCEM